MRFTTFVWKNVARRRTRSLLTVVGLSIAVAAVVSLVGISIGFEKSFRSVFETHGVSAMVLRAGQANWLQSSLDAQLVGQVRTVPGVAGAYGVMMETVAFPERGLHAVAVQGLDPAGPTVGELKLREGRTLRPGDGKAVLLGRVLAEHLGKKAGDRLSILDDDSFEVVGVFDSLSHFENTALLMPLGTVQELMDRNGQVTSVQVWTDGSRPVEAVCGDIERLGKAISARPTEDFIRTTAGLIVAKAIAWLTSALALVVGGVGMLNTMITSVFERTREIGILRAIGWRKTRIVRMVLMEAALLSLAGAACGSLGGWLLTQGLSRVPAASSAISGTLDPVVYLYGVLIALGVGVLGALWPAVHGARLQPTEALRHD